MKLLKQILLIPLLIFCLSAKSQNMNEFYAHVNWANNLAEIDKIDSAITIYEQAFEMIEYIHVCFLKKALTLSKQIKDKQRVGKYKRMIKEQNKGSNPQLTKIIDSLISIDQQVRSNKYKNAINFYNTCLQQEGCDYKNKKITQSKHLRDKRLKVDSLNFLYLLNLFQEFSFLGEEQLGLKFQAVDVLLFHACDLNNSKSMIPFLEKALINGRILPTRYAQIMDLCTLLNNGSQTYWMLYNISNHESAFSNSEIEAILQTRESIGIYNSKLLQEKKGNYWVLRNVYNN